LAKILHIRAYNFGGRGKGTKLFHVTCRGRHDNSCAFFCWGGAP